MVDPADNLLGHCSSSSSYGDEGTEILARAAMRGTTSPASCVSPWRMVSRSLDPTTDTT